MSNPLVDPAGIFNRALAIYREHAAVLFPIALIVGLIQAIALFVLGDAQVVFLALAITLVASAVFQAMVVEVARDVQDGRPERSAGELFQSVTPVVVPLLIVSLLAGIGIVLGLLLLIVPGLMLLTMWAVVAPVVVIERPGVIDAFRRSVELVRGHGWPVFGLILMVVALFLVVGLVSGLAVAGLGGVAGNFVQLLIGAAVTPIMSLVTAVLYFQLVELHAAQTIVAPGPQPDRSPDDSDRPTGI